MKFAKTARDSTGQILHEGDIVNVILHASEPAFVVVRKVIQRRRDQFPTLRGIKVVTDWKGKVMRTERVELDIDTYKQSVVINPSALQDNVPLNDKLKEIRASIKKV